MYYDVGLSSCGKILNRELFSEYADNGITHMEISESNYDGFDYKTVGALAKEFSVKLWSLHLPFAPFERFEISALDSSFRRSTLEQFSEIIEKGAEIGIDKFVVHPSGEPIVDAERGERIKYSRETLSLLANICEKNASVLCVEDLPRTCLGHSSEEMLFLTAEDSRLKICFDTNHINTETPEEVICALGKKIITLHVSDFDFINERHWLPAEGKINWKNVLNALEKIGYSGPFLYEIGYKCPNNILRDRDLNAADFRKNARELFDGKQPTVISRPKPNLGFFE